MTNEEIITNAFGAIIGIKVLDTGMKLIDQKPRKGRRHKGFL